MHQADEYLTVHEHGISAAQASEQVEIQLQRIETRNPDDRCVSGPASLEALVFGFPMGLYSFGVVVAAKHRVIRRVCFKIIAGIGLFKRKFHNYSAFILQPKLSKEDLVNS